MSTPSQNNDNQEIDLSQISKKIGVFFESISIKIFRGLLFIKKNIIIIGILFFMGIILGNYLDKKIKEFDNEIIVAPNFGSTDYLYSKITLINSKIKERDTVFLKEVVGINKPKEIRKITIEPITDVYKFIDNKEENFELIKLMAEDGDIKKIIQDNVTSKNYPYHTISFKTTTITNSEKTVSPILKYLNTSNYYSTLQKEYLNNIKLKIIANDSVISQIDAVLNSFSGAVNGSQRNDKLIYYNENTQLNDVIKTKNELVREQGALRLDLVSLDKIIKESSSTINNKNEESLNGKRMLILPFIFISLFILVRYIRHFYKKQIAKSNL
jgi:hypothetical protein